MNLKVAYILGAGLGTRMGPIGTSLPKLLWPVFEKSLLELQIDYAIECGAEKIYLNTHFQANKIQSYVDSNEIDVEIIFEEELLDIGGAVHNLARKLNYEGQVLILNGDQFLMLSEQSLNDFKLKSKSSVASLLGLKVPANSQYNELIVKDSLLCSIEKPSSSKEYYTFSGVSIINLEMLKACDGASKFFDTVADYNNEDVFVYHPEEFEYWDFGTTERYINSMRNVLKMPGSRFKEFLIRNKAFMKEKVLSDLCYNSRGVDYSINLNDEFLENGLGNIVIDGKDLTQSQGTVVIYKDKVSGV
ncbi:NDP-sugar synthase [Halobacteriovorax sp.]|uniref:nucleotidyltransferase family protein n=1 Tax=Halobacteriovorax sp. TaxID=2020862 RepID=UPI003561B644